MTTELLTSIAGILLSLAFNFIPGLNDWYNKQASEYKRLIMLGALVIVAGASFGLSCAGLFGIDLSCDQAGAEKIIISFVLALVANQSTFLITPKPERFRK